jgi:glycosyltransferase involved in cell wall biosynthesis
MKILTLNFEFPPLGGGASPVSHEIAKRLVDLGHEVELVTMSYRDLPRQEVIDGIKVIRVPSLRKHKSHSGPHEHFSFIISAKAFLKKYLKINKFDICHTHFLIPTGIIAEWAKRKFDLDYVVTMHGSDVPGYNSDRFKFLHKFTAPMLRKICSNAKAVTSPSEFLLGLAKKNIGEYIFEHIPNGIDLDMFGVDPNKPKKNVILTATRLLERKGVQTLINSVKDIELPFEVHIAGDGPYKSKLEEIANGSRTKIVFHGWVDKGSRQMKQLYEDAAIFALPSAIENASISLLEGMAAKCAVITSNQTGCPETVGDSGITIDFDDVASLQKHLIELTSNPELVKEYGEKGFERLNKKFLWDDIIEDYIDVFRS